MPGAGLRVPIWILGSSLYGAQVAAALGLPFAFASHFAPAQLVPALAIYREALQTVGAARTAVRDARLQRLRGRHGGRRASPLDLGAAGVREPLHRPPVRAPAPVRDFDQSLPPPARAALADVLSCSAIGTAETVRDALVAFVARTGADELMIASRHLRPRGAPALLRDRRHRPRRARVNARRSCSERAPERSIRKRATAGEARVVARVRCFS